MTSLERMARAYDPVGWGWYDRTAESDNAATKHTRDLFCTAAFANMSAALAAIRVPSEGMVAAGAPVGRRGWEDIARGVWSRMIDAALKEG